MRTVTGSATPDNRSYRIDTFIDTETPANGRTVKRVTVVVRRSDPLQTLARLTSVFDQSTATPGGGSAPSCAQEHKRVRRRRSHAGTNGLRSHQGRAAPARESACVPGTRAFRRGLGDRGR